MKKIALIVLFFCVLAAGALVLVSGLAVYSGRQQSALLLQPPQHGTSILIAADLSQARGGTNTLADLKETIQRRLYKFGTRIFWESVPGSRIHLATPVTDPNQFETLRTLISQSGHLEFRLVHENSDQLVASGEVPADYELLAQHSEAQPSGQPLIERVVVKTAPESGLTGNIVKAANVLRNSTGQSQIYFQLNPESTAAFASLTRTNLHHRLAIVMDGQLYSAPVIVDPIETGAVAITGNFSPNEARTLADLMGDPLPVPVTLVEFKTFLSSMAKPAASVRLRLRVTTAAETAVRSGHPWVFSESIQESNRAGQMGELAVIYDRKDKFLAVGLFDPDSPIRVRILHAGKPQTIDAVWWQTHLELALGRRAGLFDAQTTGYRLIHGESDGWPGLVLDRYDTTLVLKLYSAAWLPWLDKIQSLIQEKIPCERVVLRLSRNIQAAAERWSPALHDGDVLFLKQPGSKTSAPVIFSESGIRFEADVLRGQKTGFFLDQRENRREVETLARGRRVLNAFSFSGGFSVYAARGGAVSVTDLDISPHALESARRNFALNQNFPNVAACRHETVQADAFEWIGKIAREI